MSLDDFMFRLRTRVHVIDAVCSLPTNCCDDLCIVVSTCVSDTSNLDDLILYRVIDRMTV